MLNDSKDEDLISVLGSPFMKDLKAMMRFMNEISQTFKAIDELSRGGR